VVIVHVPTRDRRLDGSAARDRVVVLSVVVLPAPAIRRMALLGPFVVVLVVVLVRTLVHGC
jgi:hypothetical protein